MCKRIFVAIDGSTTGDAALGEAINLARAPDTHLCIGTVLDSGLLTKNSMGMGALMDVDKIKADMRQKSETVLDKAVKRAEEAGLQPYRVLVESDKKRVAELIVEAAKRWDADLIVIGTHGRRGFKRMVMGSVAENLVRIATTSLFLVRKK